MGVIRFGISWEIFLKKRNNSERQHGEAGNSVTSEVVVDDRD
jgi:hypothetical protein